MLFWCNLSLPQIIFLGYIGPVINSRMHLIICPLRSDFFRGLNLKQKKPNLFNTQFGIFVNRFSHIQDKLNYNKYFYIQPLTGFQSIFNPVSIFIYLYTRQKSFKVHFKSQKCEKYIYFFNKILFSLNVWNATF